MTGLSHTVLHNVSAIILTLSTLIAMLFGLCIWLFAKLSSLQNRWSQLLKGANGSSLETILYDHLRERMALKSDFDALEKRTHELEIKMATSKRHMGLVRFDAFNDVGGSQSFALALFDDHGDGTVMSSLIGRSDCRVYCKPLSGGRSERSLSQEEQRAIGSATSSAPKAIVSS